MKRCALLALLCWLAGQATAQAPDALDAARREAVAHDRSDARARYEQATRACAAEFAAVACLDRAKAERRETMDRLEREQATLDSAARKRHAAERQRRLDEKATIAAARSAASAPPASPRASAPRADPITATPREPRASDPAASAAAAENARRHAAAAEQRRAEAEAHAEAVRRRNAERAAAKPPAAGLPAPSAPRLK